MLFVSCGRGDSTIQITPGKIEVGLLRSNQEEARTPVLFYMLKNAVGNWARVIVVHNPDTDVLILLLHITKNHQFS